MYTFAHVKHTDMPIGLQDSLMLTGRGLLVRWQFGQIKNTMVIGCCLKQLWQSFKRLKGPKGMLKFYKYKLLTQRLSKLNFNFFARAIWPLTKH